MHIINKGTTYMGYSEIRQHCYDWFDKTYRGKLGVVAFEPAFLEVSLASWCACASLIKNKDKQQLQEEVRKLVNRLDTAIDRGDKEECFAINDELRMLVSM